MNITDKFYERIIYYGQRNVKLKLLQLITVGSQPKTCMVLDRMNTEITDLDPTWNMGASILVDL
jgi:hypothetical protein